MFKSSRPSGTIISGMGPSIDDPLRLVPSKGELEVESMDVGDSGPKTASSSIRKSKKASITASSSSSTGSALSGEGEAMLRVISRCCMPTLHPKRFPTE